MLDEVCGLDVHQATTSATVRESSGKIIARSVLPTEDAALLEFFARDARRGARGLRGRHAGAVAARSALAPGDQRSCTQAGIHASAHDRAKCLRTNLPYPVSIFDESPDIRPCAERLAMLIAQPADVDVDDIILLLRDHEVTDDLSTCDMHEFSRAE